MDAFSYLSVLLSIILGLAITQVLQGFRGLLLARSRARLYAPTLIWSALVLVMAVQSWWASFGLADHRDWTFAGFGTLLLQTSLLYMMAALVLPDVPADQPVDLRAHYEREITPFFAISIAMLAASIAKDAVIDGTLPTGENLLFHAAFASVSAFALAVRRHWAQLAAALLTVLLVAIYIAILFARLSLA